MLLSKYKRIENCMQASSKQKLLHKIRHKKETNVQNNHNFRALFILSEMYLKNVDSLTYIDTNYLQCFLSNSYLCLCILIYKDKSKLWYRPINKYQIEIPKLSQYLANFLLLNK